MHRTRLTIVAFLALLALPNAFGSLADERRLRFYHTHTGAHLDVVYYRNGTYQRRRWTASTAFCVTGATARTGTSTRG
jgi:type II secretory pathway pseudopilin PulG